jgi:hypothetical protein
MDSVNDHVAWEEPVEAAMEASIRDRGGQFVDLTRDDDNGAGPSRVKDEPATKEEKKDDAEHDRRWFRRYDDY